jgi:hypothetical protein
VIAAGLSGVTQGEPAIVYQPGELESYAKLNNLTRQGDLVLTGERTGNRLPAFMSIRVIYGHPFETPDSETQRDLVRHLFTAEGVSLEVLQDLGISWVYYGIDEKQLGYPAWLADLQLVWERGELAIYEVPPE